MQDYEYYTQISLLPSYTQGYFILHKLQQKMDVILYSLFHIHMVTVFNKIVKCSH